MSNLTDDLAYIRALWRWRWAHRRCRVRQVTGSGMTGFWCATHGTGIAARLPR